MCIHNNNNNTGSAMKPHEVDAVSLSTSSISEIRGDSHDMIMIDKPQYSSPKSAIGRLCRKLSLRKAAPAEKLSLSVGGLHDHDHEAAAQNCSNEKELQRRVFRYFDENGDGMISPAELQSCVSTVGGELSPEEAEMAVRTSDSDGDGMLGFEDFAKLMDFTRSEEERKEELREAFGMYAMEGTGCITPKSLKRMLSRLGESTTINNCKAMIRKFDLNGDGVLNFDEFKAMMR